MGSIIYPLRAIVRREQERPGYALYRETYACGHSDVRLYGSAGDYACRRRRCWQCPAGGPDA